MGIWLTISPCVFGCYLWLHRQQETSLKCLKIMSLIYQNPTEISPLKKYVWKRRLKSQSNQSIHRFPTAEGKYWGWCWQVLLGGLMYRGELGMGISECLYKETVWIWGQVRMQFQIDRVGVASSNLRIMEMDKPSWKVRRFTLPHWQNNLILQYMF